MELTEKDIECFNSIYQKSHNRDATLDEMYELKRNINKLLEMIYECFVRDKKSGRLEEIMEENTIID